MGEGVLRSDYLVPRKLDPSLGRISQAVGVLGMLALTAYAGMNLMASPAGHGHGRARVAARGATDAGQSRYFGSHGEDFALSMDLSQRKDGALLGQPDGLLRALDLLAFPERNFPSPIKGPAQRTGSAQDDWAAPRDPLTGY